MQEFPPDGSPPFDRGLGVAGDWTDHYQMVALRYQMVIIYYLIKIH